MKVDDNERNEGNCICGDCPSYPGTGEMLFCARGKSREGIMRNGCLCPSCEVYGDYNLSGGYFCAEGAAT